MLSPLYTHVEDTDVAFRAGRCNDVPSHPVSIFRNTVTGLHHLVATDPGRNQFRTVVPDDKDADGNPRWANRSDAGISHIVRRPFVGRRRTMETA